LLNVVVQSVLVLFWVGLHVHIQDRRPAIATRDFLELAQLLRCSAIANWAALYKRSGWIVSSCNSVFKEANDRLIKYTAYSASIGRPALSGAVNGDGDETAKGLRWGLFVIGDTQSRCEPDTSRMTTAYFHVGCALSLSDIS
jgi:hypothetical protein